MDNQVKAAIASGVLTIGLALGGLLSVKNEKTCDQYNGYHVHKYVRTINDDVEIVRYAYSEKESIELIASYEKQDEFIPTTLLDLENFKLLDKSDLFDGRDNIDYIHYQINKYRDYLEYYYHYTETKIVYETESYTDSEGHTHTRKVPKTVTETHSGWSTDPYHRGVTGEVRVNHRVYYGYKIVYENDTFTLIKSNAVDDIREIINEYPYMNENTNYEIYENFDFPTYKLGHLNIEEFDPFYTPTVENNPLDNYEAPSKLVLK